MLMAVLLLGAVVLVFVAFSHPPASAPAQLRYRRQAVLTKTELRFFERLLAAFPEQIVVPQMAMSAIIEADISADNKADRHKLRGKISQKRMDFVVLDRKTCQVLHVIELDDATHDKPSRKQEDANRDAILASVGYRTHRFDARKMPTAEELRGYFSGQAATKG